MSEAPAGTGRAIQMTLVAIIAVAFVGFVIGLVGTDRERESIDTGVAALVRADVPSYDDAVPARSYDDMRRERLGPNATWRSEIASLIAASDAGPDTGPAVKTASLERRASRRAYNGAPPVIPHAVDQVSNEACLICHGAALRAFGRGAPGLPHPHLTNCTQCHAPPAPIAFGESPPLAANAFIGVTAPFAGARAWTGAPPVVPHSTLMRENCLACHGPTGLAGMRTTHPERTACLQCHAPSAMLDQRGTSAEPGAFLGLPATGP